MDPNTLHKHWSLLTPYTRTGGPLPPTQVLEDFEPLQGGGGDFRGRGEFRGENFAVKKGGEIFPWSNFGVTVPSFTTAAGIVFPEQGQA